MKKFFVIPFLAVALTACTLPGTATPSDYASLYNANVKAEMEKAKKTYQVIYGEAKEASGKISTAIELLDGETPIAFSGNADFNTVTNQGLAEINLTNPKTVVKAQEAGKDVEVTASLSELNIIGGSMSSFVRYMNPSVVVNSSDEATKKTLEENVQKALTEYTKFAGKWIDLNDTASLSEEQQKVMARLATLSPDDFEKYLTTYHIFTPTTDTPVQNGTKYAFNVQLNSDNIVALINQFSLDIGGKGLTEEEKTEAKNALAKIVLENATIEYDTTDPLYSVAKMTISNTDNPYVKFVVEASRMNENLALGFTLMQDSHKVGKLAINATTKGDKTDFSVTASADLGSGEEIDVLSLTGNVLDGKLEKLDGTVNALAIGGKLAYTRGDKLSIVASQGSTELFNLTNTFSGENFEGNVTLQGTEMAHWKAEISKKVLSGLSLVVNNIGGLVTTSAPLLDMQLTKQENSDMISGPLKVALADDNVTTARLALQVEGDEKFGIVLDEITSAVMMPLKKFEFFVTQKISSTSKTVTIPKEFISLSEFENSVSDDVSTDMMMYPTELLDENMETSAETDEKTENM